MAHVASSRELINQLPHPIPFSVPGASGVAIVRRVNPAPTIKTVPGERSRLTLERQKKQALLELKSDLARTEHGAIHLVSSRASGLGMAKNDRLAGYRLVKPGIPGHGMIIHYAQQSAVEIPGLLAQRGAPYQPSAELQAKVRRCQRRILDALLISEVKHVFTEGLDRTLVPDAFEAGSEFARFRDQVRDRFRGYQPGQKMTPKQEELLYADGSLIYGYLATGVTLHPTTNAFQVAKLDAYFADPANRNKLVANKFMPPTSDHSLFFAEAEQAARVELMQVMQGKSLTAALIFGKAHQPENFTLNFDAKNFSPAVYSRDMTD